MNRVKPGITRVLALVVATCGLSVFGATVLEQSFAGLSALPTGWTAENSKGGGGVTFENDAVVVVNGWKGDRVYTSVDIHRGAKYTITAVTYETTANANAVLFLGSANYSICIGHSYDSNKDIDVGSIAGNASTQFVTFQSNTGTNPSSLVTVASSGDVTLTSSLTYSLVIEGTSLSVSVTDANSTVKTATFTLPADTTFTSIGMQIDGASKTVGLKSIKVENNDAVATLSSTDSAAWADIWDSGSSAPLAGTNAVIHVNADKTVTSSSATSFKTLVLTSEATEEKTLTLQLAANSVMTVDKLVMDAPLAIKPPTGSGASAISATTIEATKPLTIDTSNLTVNWSAGDGLKNLMKNSAIPQVILKDASSKTEGVYAQYSDMGGVTFSNHWVIASGAHTIRITNGSTNYNIADKTTAENPWILVQDGATLNLYGKDLGGWNGNSYKAQNCVIRVNDGGTLNLGLYASSSTFYYQGRYMLDPGATMAIGDVASNFRINGGITSGAEQIYVADQDSAGSAAKITAQTGATTAKIVADSNSAGFAFYVGNNATLDVEVPIANRDGNQGNVAKNGAGLLNLKASFTDLNADTTFTVNGGTLGLSVLPGVPVTMASGTRLTANADLNITTAVALNDAKIAVAEGKTLKLTNITSNGGIREIRLAANATNEITVASGSTISVITDGITGSGTLVKKGAGTLVLKTANSSFSGRIIVEEGVLARENDAGFGTGSVDVKSNATIVLKTFGTGIGAITFETSSKIAFAPTMAQDGTLSIDGQIPSGVTTEVVTSDYSTSLTITKNEYDSSTGKTTVNYTQLVSGKGCLWDFTFTNTLNSVGTSTDPKSMTRDTSYGIASGTSCYTANSNALFAAADPYMSPTYPTEWSASTYAKLPAVTNATLMAFGTQADGAIALITGDPTKNEVKLVRTTGNSAYTTLVTMTVPNATTASHLYSFCKSDKSIVIYLDTTAWTTYTTDGSITFGNGFQMGSLHGGTGYTGLVQYGRTYFDSANEDNNATVGMLRIYDGVLGPNAIRELAKTWSYVSPNGSYERTITDATANISAEGTWTKADDTKTYAQPAGGSAVKLTVNETSEVTVNATFATESLNITGSKAVTFVKSGSNTVKNEGLTTIGTTTTIKYGALDISGGPTVVAENTVLTFDLSDYTADPTAPSSLILTGTMTQDAAKIAITKPTTMPTGISDFTLVYNASLSRYEATITYDHEAGSDVYYQKGYIGSDGDTSMSLTNANGKATIVLPGDTLVFNAQSMNDSAYQAWVSASLPANVAKMRFDHDFKLMPGGDSAILGGVTITVASDASLTLASSGSHTLTLGAVTLNGETVKLGNGVTVSGAVTGTSTIQIASGSMVTVSSTGSIANPIAGAGTLALNGCTPTGYSGLQDTTWTGTLWLNNYKWPNWDFGALGYAGSKVALSGVTGHSPNNSSSGCNAPVELKDTDCTNATCVALQVTDSYEGSKYFFAEITGSGTLDAAGDNTSTSSYYLKDVSKFTGTLKATSATKAIVLGTDTSADGVNGAIMVQSGMTVTNATATWAANVGTTVNGVLKVGSTASVPTVTTSTTGNIIVTSTEGSYTVYTSTSASNPTIVVPADVTEVTTTPVKTITYQGTGAPSITIQIPHSNGTSAAFDVTQYYTQTTNENGGTITFALKDSMKPTVAESAGMSVSGTTANAVSMKISNAKPGFYYGISYGTDKDNLTSTGTFTQATAEGTVTVSVDDLTFGDSENVKYLKLTLRESAQ